MNTDFGGLEWEFSELCTTLDFMDLTLSIRDNRIHTTLFEKASNLHLYLPPHSAHPRGVLSGLIMGNIYRFYNLCTDPADVRSKTLAFYRRLIARGHKRELLRPMFHKAIAKNAANAANAANTATRLDDPQRPPASDNNRIFFHLRYHPNDPPAREIQRRWHDCIAAPPGSTPLFHLRNQYDLKIGLDRLIVCYHHPLNLGNLLSSRQIVVRNGPPVSSYRRIRNSGGPRDPEQLERTRTNPTQPPASRSDEPSAPDRAVVRPLYSIFRPR